MEDSKQAAEKEKQGFFDHMAQSKKANELKHPKGWLYEPQNVHARTQKEIWAFVRSQWVQIIDSVDQEMFKAEESKEEDKKGRDQLSIQTILLEKLSDMKKVITFSDTMDENQLFNPWNVYFSSQTPAPIEELNVNLGKLIAVTSSKGPQYQSLDRAEKFFTDLEKNVTKLNEIVNETNESRKKKRVEEIPSIEDYVKQIQVNVRAMSANLTTFNQKENEKIESQNLVIDLIRMQFGLQKELKIIEKLSQQEKIFLTKIKECREQTYQSRANLSPCKFTVYQRQQQLLDKCLSPDEVKIELQVIAKNQKSGYYLGEMKYNGSANLTVKEKNDEDDNFIVRLFRRNEPLPQLENSNQNNYLIQTGAYSMHGRGMFFDKDTGELFEGWFEDNNLIEGRCIIDDTVYVGSFQTSQDGKFVKNGWGSCYYSNGTRYLGNWKDNLKHGEGETYFANRLSCLQNFIEGAPKGIVTFQMDYLQHQEKKYPEDEKGVQEISKLLYEQKRITMSK